MAVSQEQKVDFLLKKLGFTKTKTGLAVDSTLTGTKKAGFAEAIPSPLIIANSSVWNEADSIPATPPGSDTNQVRVYLAATSGHRMTVDTTVADNRAFIAFSTYNDTSSTRLNNWIDTQFGAGYLIKVFKGDPNSGGVQLSAAGSGQNDGWFFDYSAGVLNFNDTNVPSGVTGTNIYVVGYRYIGQTGAPTSGISTFSFLDLSVERNLDVGVQGGISTFRNNIDLNADLDVDGHTNLDNVSIAGVTTFSSNLDVNADIDVDGHTELDNVNITGFTTFHTGTRFYHHTPRIEMQGNSTATLSFVNNTTGTTTSDGMLMGFSSSSTSGFINVLESGHGFILKTGGSALGNERINISGVGTVSLRYGTSEEMVTARPNGAVELYHNGIKRLETSSVGVSIPQDLDVDGHTNLDNVSVAGVTTFADDITFQTASGNNIVFDKSDNSLQFGDNVAAKFGSGNHLRLFHSGSVGVLRNSQGNFKIEPTPNEKGLVVLPNAGVELYYDNVQKLVTTSSGISIAGSIVATGNVTAVDGTFSGNVSIGGTLTYEDVKNVDSVGLITARSGIRVTGGIIEAQAGENKIPFLYANTSSLPDPSTYHGMFAHVHATQKGYFAHAGNWYELVNRELTGTVGTGTETYNIKNLNIAGVSTFAGITTSTSTLFANQLSVAGISTFGGDVSIAEKIVHTGDTTTNISFPEDDSILFKTNNYDRLRIHKNQYLVSVGSTGDIANPTNSRFRIGGRRINQAGAFATLEFMNGLYSGSGNSRAVASIRGQRDTDNYGVMLTFHTASADPSGLSDGSAERLRINRGGDLIIQSGQLYLPNQIIHKDDSDTLIEFETDTINFDTGGTQRLRINSSGNAIFSGNIDANADLDVDGHTNLDNVSIAGVTTISNNLYFADSTQEGDGANGNRLKFGNSNDFQLYYDGNAGNAVIFKKDTGGTLQIRSERVDIKSFQNTKTMASFYPNGAVQLRHNNALRFETTSVGVSIPKDLDVDGHTNLDNVSISGVSTFTGDATFNGNITFGDATIDNVVFTGDVNSNIIPNTDNTYTLGTSSKRWAAIHVGLSTVGEDITTRNLDVSGIGTIGSGSSGQAILEYQGSLKLTSEPWGTRTTGTVQALGGNLQQYQASANSTGNILLTNQTGNALKIGHASSNSFITGVVGDISINAPTVSISTNFTVAGVTTLSGNTVQGGQLQLNSTLKAGGTVGSNGYYLKSTGIGVTWSAFPTARTTQSFTASSGQTTFNFAYNVNYLDVFVNGTKLTTSEFTATNGTSVVLAVGCFVGDIVDLISYNVIASGGATGIDNIVEDVTPQLGGNLDLFNKTITGTGNINMTGVATATKFVGDGSGLTGIVASGSGVVVKDNGSAVGTAGTINFGTNLDVSDISAGIVTVTAAGITTANITSDTITSGTLNVTGISTFSSLVKLPDSTNNQTGRLMLGTGTDLQIFHTGSAGEIGNFTGILNIKSNSFRVFNGAGTQAYITADQNSSVSIAFSGTNKLATTASGIDVTGTAVNDGMVCAGVGTFSGLINANANIKRATGNLDINASNIVLKNAADSATYASFNNGGNVELHFNNVKRFETTNTGAVVAGIMTATSFSGDGSNLTGISGSGLFAQTDVGIHTLSKVGIGTTNPTEVLHVSDGGNPFILIEDTNADNQVGVKFKTTLYNWIAGLHGGIDTFKISKSTAFGTNDFFSISNTGIVSIEKDLDVDGHTELDNTNIVGIVTVTNTSSGTALKLIDSSNKQFAAGGGGGGSPFSGSLTNHDFRIQVGGTQNAIFKYAAGATGNLELGPSSGIGITFNGSTGNAGYAGIVTAANFVGDGSGLTGVVGSGSGVVVQHDGSNIGTAGTINFSTNLDVSAISAGIVTVTASGGGGTDVGITTNLSGTFTASAGTPSTINTFTGYSSDDLVVEYTIYIKNGSDFQTQKLLAMRDGTTIHSTQFAVMFSSSLLVQCDATISSGNILLRATPETGVSGSTTYKVKREVM